MPRRRPSRRFRKRRFGGSRTKRTFKRRRITKRRPSISQHSYKFVRHGTFSQVATLVPNTGIYVDFGPNATQLSLYAGAVDFAGQYSYYRIKKAQIKVIPLQKEALMAYNGTVSQAFVQPRICTVIDHHYPSILAASTDELEFEQFPSFRETAQGKVHTRTWTPTINVSLLETTTAATAYSPKRCPWIPTSLDDVQMWGYYGLFCWDQSITSTVAYEEYAAGNFEVIQTIWVDFKQPIPITT